MSLRLLRLGNPLFAESHEQNPGNLVSAPVQLRVTHGGIGDINGNPWISLSHGGMVTVGARLHGAPLVRVFRGRVPRMTAGRHHGTKEDRPPTIPLNLARCAFD